MISECLCSGMPYFPAWVHRTERHGLRHSFAKIFPHFCLIFMAKMRCKFVERVFVMQADAIILATVFIVAFGSLFSQGNSREVTVHGGPGSSKFITVHASR